MKTMVKLINGTIEKFDKRYVKDEVNHVIHTHPTEEILRKCGYKEYVESDIQLEEKEGYNIGFGYRETEDQIILEQQYFEISDENEEEIIDDTEINENNDEEYIENQDISEEDITE